MNTDRDRKLAVTAARRAAELDPVIFDTETSGLDDSAEIVEISVVDLKGNVLLDSLVQPKYAIPEEATAVHGIFNEDVAGAPTFDNIVGSLDELFRGRLVVAYNLAYDLRLISQSLRHRRLSTRPFEEWGKIAYSTSWGPGLCVMRAYSHWHGEWNFAKKGYRWHKLDKAARSLNVEFPQPQHRSKSDALATAGVLRELARAGS